MINNNLRFRCTLAGTALMMVNALCHAQGNAPPPLTSPKIEPSGDVTFRLRAPNANQVRLTSGGDIPVIPFGGGLEMTRSSDGVWEVTLESLDSGAYRYSFEVDGVSVLDPSNRMVSESNSNAWSLFYVSGSAFMDTQSLPHGAVAEVNYYSTELKRHRRMHVYTPPEYQLGQDAYPVFYLLHGAMDSDDSWSSIGRAGFILDNLIAAGEAEPMIMIMPDGHTERFRRGVSGLPINAFAREFAADIKPYIEQNYRVMTGRQNAAIAGLSMGGGHALEIAVSALDEYGYVGVFSSGVFSVNEDSSWQDNHKQALNDATLKEGLELVWFSTGSEDFLLDTTEATVDLLRQHGFDVEYDESAGGHTWINWREYLSVFVPRLFK